jgi:hypothetical protein
MSGDDSSATLRRAIARYRGDILQDVFRVGTIKQAEAITGGLSRPSKMPEWAYDIPAVRCRVGSMLAQKEGTVCSDCYARKGWYFAANVQEALERRYQSLGHPLWVPAMVLLIRRRLVQFFRWHSSGDLQGIAHLQNIALVAQHTSDTRHWLPTREYDVVRSFAGDLPDNLTVRVSSHRIDGVPPGWWPQTSTVTTGEAPPGSFRCPAPEQQNRCDECRACWNKDVRDICYRLH